MKLTYRFAAVTLLAALSAVPAMAARHHRPKPAPAPNVVAAAAMPAPPAPAEKPSITLAEALAIAYETNPQLAAQQASLRATDENVAIANGGWRPTISAGGTYAFQQFFFNPVVVPGVGTFSSISGHPIQAQITVTQPILRGGRTYAQIGRAKAQVRSARATLIAAEQTVLLSAATAYMDVVRDTQVLKLRQHNVEVLQKQAEATSAQFKAGSLTRTDVAQSQARLAAAQSDLTAAQSQLAISNANFIQAIGRTPETLESEPALPPALPTGVDDSITLALKQNPAIVQARENEIAADYSVNDAIGAMLPTLSLQGQYGLSQGALISPLGTINTTPGGSTSHALTITGQLNVPIYQAGVEEATLRQAKELHAQSQLNVSVSDRQVRDAVAVAWAQFEAAEASIASNEAAQRANEIAFEGVSKEQQVGGRTILDVLNAEQELLNASVALVSAKRNAEVAAFQVLASDGALTAKNLGLKVQLYDPLQHYDDDANAFVGFGD